MSLPGFNGGASLYKTTGFYHVAGAAGFLARTVDISLPQQLQCPPPQQVCGFGAGFDFAFCCPPQAPVCCDPGCAQPIFPSHPPGSPICTACCPRDHPNCCHQVPGPDGGNGDGLPLPRPGFGCPAGKEACGVVESGPAFRQACCEPGKKCCDPDTHFCCPNETTSCCFRGTATSSPVDLCCDPAKEICISPGVCCPAEKVCKDKMGVPTCCTAMQTCTTVDGCCPADRVYDKNKHCCPVDWVVAGDKCCRPAKYCPSSEDCCGDYEKCTLDGCYGHDFVTRENRCKPIIVTPCPPNFPVYCPEIHYCCAEGQSCAIISGRPACIF